MYSLTKEKRLNELIQNKNVKWSAQELDENINSCEISKNNKAYCECTINFFSQYIQPRDYEMFQYPQSNPYAFASIKNDFLSELVQKSHLTCKSFANKL